MHSVKALHGRISPRNLPERDFIGEGFLKGKIYVIFVTFITEIWYNIAVFSATRKRYFPPVRKAGSSRSLR
jgi:hypothetical protein